tara:strand:+ start:828 stop:1118 length:291 start_codon:yes stop_codon:yes gene_type:complete
MTRYKIVNGEKIEFTAEEEAIRDQQEADFEAGRFDRSMVNLREKRNSLLAETDYLALSDNTMSEEIKEYRQQLRDITNGLTTVEEVKAVEFPTKPN